MKTKPEIKEKLEQAETKLDSSNSLPEKSRLCGVVVGLRWVLDIKTTQEPKDPTVE